MTMSQADRPAQPARPRRRVFTAAQKADCVREYDAIPEGKKGAFLRGHGLYSSHITTWRAQPDREAARAQRQRADQVAMLQDRVSALEAELAASQRTVATLGKAFELLEQISESSALIPKSVRR